MILPFTKKAKQKRILKKIHQKQDAMKKLEEEIKKMARLALKDGKLVKTDDAPQAPPQPPADQQNSTEEYGNEQDDSLFDSMPIQRAPEPPAPMAPMRIPPQPSQRPVGRPPRPPMPPPPEFRQPMPQQTFQQQQTPQDAYMPPQQQHPQQYYQAQPPPAVRPITVQIVMVNGQQFTLTVIPENMNNFISELNGSVLNKTIFPAGKHGINGAHVAWYSIET